MPASEVLTRFDERVLDRMVLAVELVKQRLLRATKALADAGVPYAVVGGNAVAAWVAKSDPTAIRNTADVDLLLDRDGFEDAKRALTAAGFVHRHSAGIDMFLDGPKGKFREAVHILFAGERVRSGDLLPTPSLDETRADDKFQVVNLEALVRMKLISFRPKDQTHLIDMIELKMIDATWCDRYPAELSDRLRELLNRPDLQFLEDLEEE
jgi:hypothetical protein